VSGFVPNVTPQPFLTFEQHAKRYGDLRMPIAPSSALPNAAVQRLPAFWNSQINIITPLALPPQANFSCVRQCEVVLPF
jgi:hypothetical protein